MPQVLPRPFRVLVVDADNTVGTVVSERLLRKHLALRGIGPSVISVGSAGYRAVAGLGALPDAAALLREYGADADGFSSRPLTRALVDEADVVFVASQPDVDEVVKRYPQAFKKTFRLTEVAELYDFIVAIAPLTEHAAMLHSARSAADVAAHYDLPVTAPSGDGLRALVDEMDKGTAWMANVWSSMASDSETHRPVPPSAGPVVDIPLDAFGVRVVVHCTGALGEELARRVEFIWSRCLRTDGLPPEVEIEACAEPDPDLLAEARLRRALAHPDLENVLHFLSSTVTVRAIDHRRGELLMLHAAGIAMPNGDVIGFVAPSGTGKTTISRVVGRHAGYVTDETLAVGFDGTVYPYPKPLSLVTDKPRGIKEQWGPDSLGLLKVSGPLRLAKLAILSRDPEAPEQPSWEPLDDLDGMAQLASQVSYLPALPEKLHSLAAVVDRVGGLGTLTYREAVSIRARLADIHAGVL